MEQPDIAALMSRAVAALERLAPPPPASADLRDADAFVWHPDGRLQAVARVSRVDLALLLGIEPQAETLLGNTRRFARGLPANNALLWGARGTGKSSLVKAVHARINEELAAKTAANENTGGNGAGAGNRGALALIEIHREDIATLPRLLGALRGSARRCVLFCDDLSFDGQDAAYKSLKAVLEGGIEGRPETVVFYATSNRRHLMPRDMIENERSSAINPAEAVEEKVSLSDRFGLWLGFHACDQRTFFAIVEGYADYFRLDIAPEQLRAEANVWSVGRGARSGRVAWQFIQDLAGRLGQPLARPPRDPPVS